MLEIKNLKAEINNKKIIKGLNLKINQGEVHAIMGPNGSGKSTLANILSGKPGYDISGDLKYEGEDLTQISIEERAQKGMFLAFQYPTEIPGVNTNNFLRTSLNSIRKAKGHKDIDAISFLKIVKEKAKELSIDEKFLSRHLNVGFSGGEKKRYEILQMALLEPTLSVLDETDSGLDVDALKVVSEGVNLLRDPQRSMLVITHYQRLLNHIVPDYVHILVGGKILRAGGKELAIEVEESGYAGSDDAA